MHSYTWTNTYTLKCTQPQTTTHAHEQTHTHTHTHARTRSLAGTCSACTRAPHYTACHLPSPPPHPPFLQGNEQRKKEAQHQKKERLLDLGRRKLEEFRAQRLLSQPMRMLRGESGRGGTWQAEHNSESSIEMSEFPPRAPSHATTTTSAFNARYHSLSGVGRVGAGCSADEAAANANKAAAAAAAAVAGPKVLAAAAAAVAASGLQYLPPPTPLVSASAAPPSDGGGSCSYVIGNNSSYGVFLTPRLGRPVQGLGTETGVGAGVSVGGPLASPALYAYGSPMSVSSGQSPMSPDSLPRTPPVPPGSLPLPLPPAMPKAKSLPLHLPLEADQHLPLQHCNAVLWPPPPPCTPQQQGGQRGWEGEGEAGTGPVPPATACDSGAASAAAAATVAGGGSVIR